MCQLAERSYGGAGDGLRCVHGGSASVVARVQVCHGVVFAHAPDWALAELFLCVHACAGGRCRYRVCQLAERSYGRAGDGTWLHMVV